MSNKANLRRLSILISVVVLATAAAKLSHVEANDNRVIFELTDEPGRWFKSTAGPIAGTHSLAVARPGVEVKFTGKSHTVHTMTSLIFPAGAVGMPFDTESTKGTREVSFADSGAVCICL
jgi:hypothetical protein